MPQPAAKGFERNAGMLRQRTCPVRFQDIAVLNETLSVVSFFYAGDDLCNHLGLGRAFVDSVAKLFHELLELRGPLDLPETHSCALRHCSLASKGF